MAGVTSLISAPTTVLQPAPLQQQAQPSATPKAEVGLLQKRERIVLRRQHLRMPSWMHRVTRHPVTGQHTISL